MVFFIFRYLQMSKEKISQLQILLERYVDSLNKWELKNKLHLYCWDCHK